MPSNIDSGSDLITTLDVAQTLSTVTTAGNYVIHVNPAPLVDDEEIMVELFDKVLTGDTTLNNPIKRGSAGAHNSDIMISIPVTTAFETVVQITQSNGTKRTFDWCVRDMS